MKVAVVCGLVLVCMYSPWDEALASGRSEPNLLCAEIRSDEVVIVKGEGQKNEWFPVETKESWRALWLSIAALIVAAVSSIGAVISAIGAWKASRGTQRAAEGQLFAIQMRDYASKEMRDHLRILFDWRRKDGARIEGDQLKDKARDWVRSLFNAAGGPSVDEAEKIDLARRHITSYFMNLLCLEKAGYISEYFVRKICESVSAGVLDVVGPLEEALIEHIGRSDKRSESNVAKDIKRLHTDFERLRILSR